LATKTDQHEGAAAEVAELERKLDDQQTLIGSLTSDLSEAERLRPENKSLQDRATDLMAHLKRLSAELDDSLDANSRAQDRILDVENQLHDHTVKIRELRRQRGSIADVTDDESGDADRRAA
jgi:predicted  nucleic acid-binding Zn-ribbon protein